LSPVPLGQLYESRTPAYFWSRVRPMVRVINQEAPSLGRAARFSCLPRHAIPLGEMLDYSALLRWRMSEEKPGAEVYRPANLETALDRTFAAENPDPIPIINEDGEPLDWVKNADHRAILQSVLPAKYRTACAEVAERLKDEPDTSDFSTSYQRPRIRVSDRR